MSFRVLLPAIGLVALGTLAPGTAPAAAASAAVDSTVAAGAPLRGTTEPLERHVAPWRWAARGALAVPYGAYTLVSIPAERAAYLNERYQPVGLLARLVTFELGAYTTRAGPLFGYASSTGLSPLGASLRNDDWLGTGVKLRAAGGYLNDRESVLAIRVSRPVGTWVTQVRGEHRRVEDVPFHGPGPRSRQRRLNSDREQDLVEAGVTRRVTESLTLSTTAYWRDQENGAPADAGPAVRDEFPELALAAENATYAGFDLVAALDGRDNGVFSTRGTLLALSGGLDHARSDGDGDYRHGAAEIQHYVDLWRGSRVLALRAELRVIDAEDPDLVPFSEWESLGGSAGPRGYARDRYLDRSAVAFTAEYRYRVTQRFEGRVFADWGSVAARAEDLRPADVDPTYGVALVVPSPDFPLVTEFAFGPEGHEWRIGFGSLFDGRSRREIE